LRALAGQTFAPERFEIIVVDDGSECSLEPAVRAVAHRARVIEQASSGPARARNRGAAAARGHLLAFTDDDCEPDANWLSVLDAHFRDTPDRALGGQTINALSANAYASASQLLVDYLYEYYGGSRRPGEQSATPPFFTSNNLAVPSDLFRRVGGFNESFPLAAGEDREFCDRWQQRGLHLRWAPGAIVRHAHGLSAMTFWRQHLNYGRGAFHLRQARAERGEPPLGLEPFSFYRRLVTYPLRAQRSHPAPVLMGLLSVAQVANAFGFALEKTRHSDKSGAQ
jgi:GT2 family glycosyltransferase